MKNFEDMNIFQRIYYYKWFWFYVGAGVIIGIPILSDSIIFWTTIVERLLGW